MKEKYQAAAAAGDPIVKTIMGGGKGEGLAVRRKPTQYVNVYKRPIKKTTTNKSRR